MAALTTGGISKTRLFERGHLDQFWQFNLLDHQLGDAITALNDDGRVGIEVDQRNPDFPAVTGVDGAGTVDDRKPHARSQTRTRMNQANHALRDCHRDTGGNQSATSGCQFDVLGAVEIDTSIAIVSAGRHG